jgi:hypothetical protein
MDYFISCEIHCKYNGKSYTIYIRKWGLDNIERRELYCDRVPVDDAELIEKLLNMIEE